MSNNRCPWSHNVSTIQKLYEGDSLVSLTCYSHMYHNTTSCDRQCKYLKNRYFLHFCILTQLLFSVTYSCRWALHISVDMVSWKIEIRYVLSYFAETQIFNICALSMLKSMAFWKMMAPKFYACRTLGQPHSLSEWSLGILILQSQQCKLSTSYLALFLHSRNLKFLR